MNKADIEKSINWLSWKYVRCLPLGSIYEWEDIRQESWLKYFEEKEKYLEDEASENTYFTRIIENALRNIVRNEWTKRGRSVNLSGNEELFESPSLNLDRELALKEVISQLPKEISSVILEGIPKELLREARTRNRMLRMRRGLKAIDGRISFTRGMFLKFFGKETIDSCRDIVYNSLFEKGE